MSLFGSLGSALGAVTGFLGTPGGAMVGQLGGNLISNLFSGSRQDAANEFSSAQYASRYQTQVADLKAAGLNPMLAYTQGAGSQPTGVAAPVTNPMSGVTQARVNSAQVANIEADTSNKQAQADLIAAQAAAQWATADQSRANITQIDANVRKIEEEIKSIPVERTRLMHAAFLLQEQAKLADKQGITETQRASMTRATAEKLVRESKLLDFDVAAAEGASNFGRVAKEYAPFLHILLDVMRRSSGR